MKKESVGNLAKLGIIAIAIGMSSQVKAVAVDLELSLLVDVSGSVDNNEFILQRDAYVDAFKSAPVINAIQSGALGSIAVNFVYWSGAGQQAEVVGFTEISDLASGTAFSNAIAAAARPFSGSTAPGSAINFDTGLFNNGFEGTREVIDVSGDGTQNAGANTADARDAALAAGIDAINGIVIGGSASVFNFYVNNIQGGAGSFTLAADSFQGFASALNTKLIREITTPVSAPTTALLGLLGLGALVATTRRRRNIV